MQNHHWFDTRSGQLERVIDALGSDAMSGCGQHRYLTTAFIACDLDSHDHDLIDPLLEAARQTFGVDWHGDLSAFEAYYCGSLTDLQAVVRKAIRTLEAQSSIRNRSDNVIDFRIASRPP